MDETASSEQAVDISKDPDLIKDSQEDISKIDVLICGNCYQTYHFIEEFQQHKSSNDECKKTDIIKQCENEPEPQVWAFTLWKNQHLKQLKETNNDNLPSSWDIYQKWIKLQQDEKDVWIIAGRNLQYFNKIATSKIEAIPIIDDIKKPEKDPLALDDEITNNSTPTNDAIKSGIIKPLSSKVVAGLAEEAKKALRTAGESGKEEFNVEKIIGKRFNPKKRLWEYHVKWENYKDSTWEPLAHLENCKDLINEYEEKIKAEKEKEKAAQASGRGRGRPKSGPNTPVKIIERKPSTPAGLSPNTVIITTPGGRPQRTSKQKALNQVKQWCGNISDSDEPNNKRPHDDGDDSDDSFEKKIKLEADSADDTEEDERTLTVKKSPKIVQYNNGVGKKLPENVLIPDAKGVVRISQKQLPSLSSGVYIMSRSSGIIKLDPAASKIATSGGGQAIVKVGPKIGQTQIKIIKKDEATNKTTILQMKADKPVSPKTSRLVQQVVKSTQMQQQQQQQQKKDSEKGVKKLDSNKSIGATTTVKKDEMKIDDEDSDYGLEDLEFPTDLPIPEPDSPPGDFVLDPITGKIAGQEYPEPEPEPEPIINETKDTTPTETIDNIVKLAAADITEEDLRPDESTPVTTPPPTVAIVTSATTPITTVVNAETSPTTSQPQQQQQREKPTVVTTTATIAIAPAATVVITTAPTTVTTAATVVQKEPVKATQSILNTAIANSNILQKTLLSPVVNRSKIVPKVINQAVATKPRTNLNPIVRSISTTVPSAKQSNLIRPKSASNLPPKPKFNISSVNSNVRNVYSKQQQQPQQQQQQNNVVRKVGPTTYAKTKTYTSPAQIRQQPQQQQKIVQKTQIVQQQKQQPQQPKPVISMPSLSVDEEPTTVTQPPQQQQQLPQPPPQQQQQQQAAVAEEATTQLVAADGDLSAFALAASGTDRPMFITGDDGTVYQVAGQNEHGQTILLTQDSDGQQQCLLVTNEAIETETTQPAQPQQQQQQQSENTQVMMEVQEQPVEMAEEQPVVAQLIRTEPPSPGGTHKVVVMLPTGEMMVTEMSQEEYANLELDK